MSLKGRDIGSSQWENHVASANHGLIAGCVPHSMRTRHEGLRQRLAVLKSTVNARPVRGEERATLITCRLRLAFA